MFVENRKTKLLIQRALKNNEIYDVSAFSEGFQAMGSSFKQLVLRRPRYKVVIYALSGATRLDNHDDEFRLHRVYFK